MTAVLDTPVYDFTEEITAGAALLDEKLPPDWRTRINLDTLDLRSVDRCVLGQLFGFFSDGTDALQLLNGGEAHGFFLPAYASEHEAYALRKKIVWGALTEQWKTYLRAS